MRTSSWIPSTPVKSLVWQPTSVTPVVVEMGRDRWVTEDHWLVSLAKQISSRVRDLFLKSNKMEINWERHSTLMSVVHMHVCVCIHIYVYVSSHIHMYTIRHIHIPFKNNVEINWERHSTLTSAVHIHAHICASVPIRHVHIPFKNIF